MVLDQRSTVTSVYCSKTLWKIITDLKEGPIQHYGLNQIKQFPP
jgi:hypothetical protein